MIVNELAVSKGGLSISRGVFATALHPSHLSPQLAQKFLLVHAVLKSLPPVNKNDGHFLVVKPSRLLIGIDIDHSQTKLRALPQPLQALLHHLAKMTLLARIKNNLMPLRQTFPPL